jgi:hypothetical protein
VTERATSPRVSAYELRVPDDTLDDLRRRLAATRLPDAVVGGRWDYGTDLDYLAELLAYWRDGFDWRAQERAVNRLEHRRTEVDGLGLHFVHQRSAAADATPLVLLHGWPGSFLQMTKLLPQLGEAFDVIVPSLPGFGLSDRPTAPGMNVAAMAALLVALMERLGQRRYILRGSDVGAGVVVQMALQAPDAVAGLHLTGDSPDIDLDRLPPDQALGESEELQIAAERNGLGHTSE